MLVECIDLEQKSLEEFLEMQMKFDLRSKKEVVVAYYFKETGSILFMFK